MTTASRRGLRTAVHRADRIAGVIETEVFPAEIGNAAFHLSLSDYVRCAVDTIVAAAEGREVVLASRAPELGGWLAELGCPTSAVRDAYWVSLRQVMSCWTEDPSGLSVEQMTRATTIALDFTETGVRKAVDAHDAVSELLRQSTEDDKSELVRQILDGTSAVTAEQAEETLSYPLRGNHMCVLVDSPERAVAARVLRLARTATGARGTLMVALDDAGWALWLAGGRQGWDELRTGLALAAVPTAIGGPREGIAGFRRAHHDAVQAQRLRPLLESGVDSLVYEDIALETVLLSDPAAARAFALDQLGPLAADNARAARMRETLSVWLVTGSQTDTAKRLNLHLNSVRLRLKYATEALGEQRLGRRTELLAALRITQALGANGLLDR
ncbi:PucR family transcriptional regulator [Lentzea sp. NPDC059081]|uniref:PucR family transcriptional regulator n=1 Tax=Lentzea sp. NPDC059081 TaxID=3346719 RepID=UPI00367C5C38